MKTNTLHYKIILIITLLLFPYPCSVQTLREIQADRTNTINESNIVAIHYGDIVASNSIKLLPGYKIDPLKNSNNNASMGSGIVFDPIYTKIFIKTK